MRYGMTNDTSQPNSAGLKTLLMVYRAGEFARNGVPGC
ncbi:MAG: hypothetical protein AVDCRST_MAG43-47 [uncultured Thermomicrobiales bacterium]|uniref:Uncharacterized protein n=1 Tax=uncultured Thermomicrobiales bacterium TaxID=1645740 RepID=A0A6J4U3Z5_9BACT|nr:MAG: hypothetical protein AVDCRST_MAG43-47 [uncultured Thermomicrobiales bacterium]